MTFSPFKNVQKEQRSFKLRRLKKTQNFKLRFGVVALLIKKEVVLELNNFITLKKFLKINLKKMFLKRSKIKKKGWFFLSANHPLTKKTKNSRMGKGKGNFIRWVIRIKRNQPIIEFKGISAVKIKVLIRKLEIKWNLNLSLLRKIKKFKFRSISLKKSFYWLHEI